MEMIAALSNEYISVKEAKPSYGGSQGWFRKTDPEIDRHGCGVIAAADVMLYLLINVPEYKNPQLLEYLAGNSPVENGIEADIYTDMIRRLCREYFSISLWGLDSSRMKRGIKKLSKEYGWKPPAIWKTGSRSFGEICSSLEQNIPVILRIGGSAGNYTDGFRKNMIGQEDFSPEKYHGRGERIFRHFVVVTGAFRNKSENWLRISTYGREAYILERNKY